MCKFVLILKGKLPVKIIIYRIAHKIVSFSAKHVYIVLNVMKSIIDDLEKIVKVAQKCYRLSNNIPYVCTL